MLRTTVLLAALAAAVVATAPYDTLGEPSLRDLALTAFRCGQAHWYVTDASCTGGHVVQLEDGVCNLISGVYEGKAFASVHYKHQSSAIDELTTFYHDVDCKGEPHSLGFGGAPHCWNNVRLSVGGVPVRGICVGPPGTCPE